MQLVEDCVFGHWQLRQRMTLLYDCIVKCLIGKREGTILHGLKNTESMIYDTIDSFRPCLKGTYVARTLSAMWTRLWEDQTKNKIADSYARQQSNTSMDAMNCVC